MRRGLAVLGALILVGLASGARAGIHSQVESGRSVSAAPGGHSRATAPPATTSGVTGIASEYGPGHGVAMHFCTWVLRHTNGCGWVRIQSAQTGRTVTAPIIDYCGCEVPNSAHPHRIVDLEYGVVDALGLARSTGLYQVTLWRIPDGPVVLADTAMRPELQGWAAAYALLCFGLLALILTVDRRNP